MARHKLMPPDNMHPIVAFTYANARARRDASNLTSADINKVARQVDDGSLWTLKRVSPVVWASQQGDGESARFALPGGGYLETKSQGTAGNGLEVRVRTSRYDRTGFSVDSSSYLVRPSFIPGEATAGELESNIASHLAGNPVAGALLRLVPGSDPNRILQVTDFPAGSVEHYDSLPLAFGTILAADTYGPHAYRVTLVDSTPFGGGLFIDTWWQGIEDDYVLGFEPGVHTVLELETAINDQQGVGTIPFMALPSSTPDRVLQVGDFLPLTQMSGGLTLTTPAHFSGGADGAVHRALGGQANHGFVWDRRGIRIEAVPVARAWVWASLDVGAIVPSLAGLVLDAYMVGGQGSQGNGVAIEFAATGLPGTGIVETINGGLWRYEFPPGEVLVSDFVNLIQAGPYFRVRGGGWPNLSLTGEHAFPATNFSGGVDGDEEQYVYRQRTEYSDAEQLTAKQRAVLPSGTVVKGSHLFVGSSDDFGTGAVKLIVGSGAPGPEVVGVVGSLYLRTDGGSNTTLYIREGPVGSERWVEAGGAPIATAADGAAELAAYNAGKQMVIRTDLLPP